MPLYLGLDVGTSAVRAIVVDQQRQLRGQSRVSLPAASESDDHRGGLEQNPDIWWQACQQALQNLAPQLRLRDIARICVDATSATTLMCDQQGQPLTPALMYNDSRAREQARQIATLAPHGHVCANPSSALAKAMWLYQHLTPDRQRDCLIQHQADWITGKFTGQFGYSDYNNCLKLGYDPQHADWPSWMDDLRLPWRLFPRVMQPGDEIADIDGQIAANLRLSPDCRIVAGTTDSTASIVAAGDLQIGDAVTTLGSTLVLKILSGTAINHAQNGVYSHFYFGRYLVGGASNSGGAVLRHYFSQAEIERLSASIDAEQDYDLDYYPLLRPGERFPIADPSLPPRLLPRPPQDSEFLHALMTGIAKIEKLGYDQLQKLGAPYPKRVITMGGGANSEVWRRIRERILGVPVQNLAFCESAMGAALLAMSAPLIDHKTKTADSNQLENKS